MCKLVKAVLQRAALLLLSNMVSDSPACGPGVSGAASGVCKAGPPARPVSQCQGTSGLQGSTQGLLRWCSVVGSACWQLVGRLAQCQLRWMCPEMSAHAGLQACRGVKPAHVPAGFLAVCNLHHTLSCAAAMQGTVALQHVVPCVQAPDQGASCSCICCLSGCYICSCWCMLYVSDAGYCGTLMYPALHADCQVLSAYAAAAVVAVSCPVAKLCGTLWHGIASCLVCRLLIRGKCSTPLWSSGAEPCSTRSWHVPAEMLRSPATSERGSR